MYLLDTDVLIWILRGNQKIVDKISVLKDKSPLGISVISIAEIYKNIFPSELTQTEDFLLQHIHFDVNAKIARIGGLYWQQYAKQFKNLSLTDCLIAATCNINEATLVTLNTKHFPMQDIQILNPDNS